MKLTDKEQTLSDLSEVRRGRIPPSRPHCPSRHSHCLVYVLSGEASYTFGKECFLAEEGSVIYLAHRSRYSIAVSCENYTYINADFFFQAEQEAPMENEIFQGKSIAMLKGDFEKLHRLWESGRPWDRLECKALLYRIYAELMRSRLCDSVGKRRAEQMEEMTRYLTEHWNDPSLTVASLAMRYRLSEGHLRRLFAGVYHISPSRFLTSLRLQKAKELLSRTQRPISSVAEECGFSNPYYFSKVFKAQIGLTPGQYRKRSCGGM